MIELPDGPYETVGGFLAAQLGKVPSAGDEVRLEAHTLTVAEMDGRRVARARLHRIKPAADSTASEEAVPSAE